MLRQLNRGKGDEEDSRCSVDSPGLEKVHCLHNILCSVLFHIYIVSHTISDLVQANERVIQNFWI